MRCAYTLFMRKSSDWVRPQCFSAKKRYLLSSSFRISCWLCLRYNMYSLFSWKHTHVWEMTHGTDVLLPDRVSAQIWMRVNQCSVYQRVSVGSSSELFLQSFCLVSHLQLVHSATPLCHRKPFDLRSSNVFLNFSTHRHLLRRSKLCYFS